MIRVSAEVMWWRKLTFHRIEDNIVITKDGSQNLTVTVKDPDEMESIISAS